MIKGLLRCYVPRNDGTLGLISKSSTFGQDTLWRSVIANEVKQADLNDIMFNIK